MPVFTRDNTKIGADLGSLGVQHAAEEGGMTISLESWKAGLDTGEMYAELPGGACPASHWGYVVRGSLTLRFTDGETETFRAGDAYYIRPGHNAHIDEDCDMVEFSVADETTGLSSLS
jgi:hypothetical protein